MKVAKKWVIAKQNKQTTGGRHWAINQILINRGLKNEKEFESFLNFDYIKQTHDPFKFLQMEKAVDLIIKHIIAHNKIMIYGDYDADGVTSSVVLAETLTTLKAETDVYIPDRVSEGYGLNKEAVKKIADSGFKLIITVDGGVRSKEEVAYAQELGLDVIITDHHLAPKDKNDLPNCLILNPNVPGETYPFNKLAGVGVAFKLAKAIISKTKLEEKDKNILENRILDLVAVGTVSDCVDLINENRILVKKGLEVINQKKQRIGLQELINVAGLNHDPNKKIDTINLGFQIGPRINAAGRMEHANTAFELLITKNINEAKMIANRLNSKNIERQEETLEIVDQVEIQKGKMLEEDRIIIGVCEDEKIWREGIVGLVAGKFCEKYNRPALIITQTKDGYKGSGRSIEEFNIMEALNYAAPFLDRFGGHPAACGFSLKKENLEKFTQAVKEFTNQKLKNENLSPKINIDVELEFQEINEDLVKNLEKIAPFGEGNPVPIFVSRDLVIADVLKMGTNEQHLKLRLTNGRSGILNALGFGRAEEWKNLTVGDRIDLVYTLEMNRYNGRSETQLKILDIKLTSE